MRGARVTDMKGIVRSDGGVASGAVATTQVLGVPLSLIDMRLCLSTIFGWLAAGKANYICVRDVHGVMRAQTDPALLAIHHGAGLVTPDGMPLVWISRLRGHSEVSRVCGADLVAALCEASVERGVRHYFYGGKEGVADRMANALAALFPGLVVAGTYTPPFGELTPEQDQAIIAEISAAKPDIIWVGLSTPKQEYWMRDTVGRIPGATMIGVGAAFDFYAGDVKRAPKWMQQNGVEWLHRLLSEPRRLWRRYLVLAPTFAVKVAREEFNRVVKR